MKKLILTLFAALLVTTGLFAQITMQISGTVTSTTTGLPVPNHSVYINTDSSTTTFYYYNTVMTDANGYYIDIVTVPSNFQGAFYIGTFDCNQTWQYGFITGPGSIGFNFNICTGNTTQCQASFYAFPDSSVSNLSYYFVDNSAGNPVSWLWSFGDGGTSTSQFPMHAYAQPGLYNVCLTISNGQGCTDTYCDSIYVANIPACYNYFSTSTQSLNVTFYGAAYGGTQPYTYFWNFGDNSTSNLQTVSHNFTQTGYYTVTLTTTDANGCIATSVQSIYVTSVTTGCQAMFLPIADSTNTLSLYFANLSTGSNLNYQWNFGDNTVSNSQYGSHTYTQAGTYMVCLTIWNDSGCQSTYCDSIYVGGSLPCSNYFYYGTQLLYATFYGYAYGGTQPYTFSWSFGDGTGSTLQNPSHSYASAGNYNVTLTTSDASGCAFTSTQSVTISNSNPATIWGQVTANNLPVDFGRIYLYGINPSGNTWYIMDTTSIDSVGYYWFGNVFQGVYAIMAELSPNSSQFGNFVPTYYGNTIFWNNATLITLGQPINPYNIELQAGIPPMFGPGNITGTITSGNKLFGSGTPLANIEIMLLDMTNNPLILDYSDASGNFNFNNLPYGTYKVYAEVGGINTNPAVITLNTTVPNSNNVSLVMTPSGITTGIAEKPESDRLSVNKLYPNPASDKLTLELSTDKSGNVSTIISDILGNEIITNTTMLTTGNNKLNINTSELTPGSYSIQCVLTDGSRIVRKLAIVR